MSRKQLKPGRPQGRKNALTAATKYQAMQFIDTLRARIDAKRLTLRRITALVSAHVQVDVPRDTVRRMLYDMSVVLPHNRRLVSKHQGAAVANKYRSLSTANRYRMWDYVKTHAARFVADKMTFDQVKADIEQALTLDRLAPASVNQALDNFSVKLGAERGKTWHGTLALHARLDALETNVTLLHAALAALKPDIPALVVIPRTPGYVATAATAPPPA